MTYFVKSRPRAVKVVAFATDAILLLEMVLLVIQAIRGQAMHFNQSTAFDIILWRFMSVTIGMFYLFDIAGGVLIACEEFANPLLRLDHPGDVAGVAQREHRRAEQADVGCERWFGCSGIDWLSVGDRASSNGTVNSNA